MRAGGPTGRLADYPDGWSAMAVREWRQGLRARTFVVPFLVLQAGLTLFGLIQLDVRNSEGVARGFWFLLLVLLSLVLPLRNLGALADERDGNTMDMLLLTNMLFISIQQISRLRSLSLWPLKSSLLGFRQVSRLRIKKFLQQRRLWILQKLSRRLTKRNT